MSGALFFAHERMWPTAPNNPQPELPLVDGQLTSRRLRHVLLIALPLWLAGCTAMLLRMDTAPLPESTESSEHLQIGVAFLPLTVDPTSKLEIDLFPSRADPYTGFFFAIPWKSHDRFEVYRYASKRPLYTGFKNGDWVALDRSTDPASPYVEVTALRLP
jgi:hypothetical protein